MQATDKLRLGPHCDSRGIVSCSDAGRPRWQSDVNKQFKRICRNAGIGSDWHCHERRHSFVSGLSDAGLDVEAIADAAGHVDSNVTRTVYRHQIADKVSRAAAVMDDTLGK